MRKLAKVCFKSLCFKSLCLLMMLPALSQPALSQNVWAANPSIVAAGYHNIVLGDNGTVWTWGLNYYGQLGDGTGGDGTDKNIPISVDIDSFTAIGGGGYNSIAIKNDGTLWIWGRNKSGQIGDGTVDIEDSGIRTPLLVAGLNNITASFTGGSHTVALKNDGTVWTWGGNPYGQLGDGSNSDRYTPGNTPVLSNVKAISIGGNHTVALKNDGTVWAWGRNADGQVGDGTTENRNKPVQVSGIDHVIAIASGGNHVMAVKNDGTLWAWGRNDKGQLGDGTTSDKSAPIQITGIGNITAIASGGSHSLAVRDDGTVMAWGDNSRGQIGDGTADPKKNIPTQVSGLTDVVYVSAGALHSVALKKDGTIWTWGSNFSSELGNGTDVRDMPISNIPVQVRDQSGTGFINLGNPITHTIKTTSGDNGRIEAAGDVTVSQGTIRVFNMIPDTGYEIDDVQADSVSVGSVSTYAFAPVYEDHTIHVTFKKGTVNVPVIETVAVTEITSSTAISGGNVTSNGGADVTVRGVCWSISQNPSTDDTHTMNGEGIGSFTSSLSNLTPGTTYYVRAYATNMAGTAYGDEISFTTSCNLPILTTSEISDVTSATASSGGNITDNGGCAITARGVCWSILQNPTIKDTKTVKSEGTGIFTSSISGLTPGTTYYVRAYATNAAGTEYGNEISFATPCVLPTVTTSATTAVTPTSADTGGNVTYNGGCTVTARGVCWSISQNPTVDDTKTVNGEGTGIFTASITGLASDTTYYVRAYATSEEGTSYGNEISFKTSVSFILSVTPDAQEVSKNSGTTTFDIANIGSGTMEWIVSEDADWFSVEPTSGTGNGSITVTYEANTGHERISIIAITAFGSENKSQSVDVIQASLHDGDVDNSGDITLDDVILILKILAGINDASAVNADADINGDKKIGMEEAAYVLQVVSDLR